MTNETSALTRPRDINARRSEKPDEALLTEEWKNVWNLRDDERVLDLSALPVSSLGHLCHVVVELVNGFPPRG